MQVIATTESNTHSELLNMYLAWKKHAGETLNELHEHCTANNVPIEKCVICSRLILDIVEMTKSVTYLGQEIDMTNIVYYFITHDQEYKRLAEYFNN